MSVELINSSQNKIEDNSFSNIDKTVKFPWISGRFVESLVQKRIENSQGVWGL